MASKAYFLGVDVSTTAVKALLIDVDGQVVAVASAPQPLSTPQPLWSEQNPQDWWSGAVQSIRSALQQCGVKG